MKIDAPRPAVILHKYSARLNYFSGHLCITNSCFTKRLFPDAVLRQQTSDEPGTARGNLSAGSEQKTTMPSPFF